MNKGYVYILTNEAMPGLVKIGKTTRTPEARALELFQTGVPVPFTVRAAFKSPDCGELEAKAHELLHDNRVNGAREFFRADLGEATETVRHAHVLQIQEMVEEFAPDMDAVPKDLAIDEVMAIFWAHECGADYATVCNAIKTGMSSNVVGILLDNLKRQNAAKQDACLSLVTRSGRPVEGGAE